MKKILISLLAMAAMATACKGPANGEPQKPNGGEDDPTVVTGDSIIVNVSKEVSNKNVLIEEFTGIYCGNCPAGHKVVNEICSEYPGRIIPINIHCTEYANDTYTTKYGNNIAALSGLTGVPSAAINRHLFSGESAIAVGRGNFRKCSQEIMNQAAPLNIAAKAVIDKASRHMSVAVRMYYTENSAKAKNKINIAILQDNVYGQQSNMNNNPDQVVNGKYRHMHMLRDLILGQWGKESSPTKAGTEIYQRYEYDIPEKLGSPNAIKAVLEDLSVVVFVTESTNMEVLNCCKAEVIFK